MLFYRNKYLHVFKSCLKIAFFSCTNLSYWFIGAIKKPPAPFIHKTVLVVYEWSTEQK